MYVYQIIKLINWIIYYQKHLSIIQNHFNVKKPLCTREREQQNPVIPRQTLRDYRFSHSWVEIFLALCLFIMESIRGSKNELHQQTLQRRIQDYF